jgi:hypothetical protein
MLAFLLVGRKKEREKRKKSNNQGAFFPEPGMLCWLCHAGFLWLLGAIRGDLMVSL